MMAAKLGWSSYGDKKYVEHVLQYYELTTLDGSVSTGEIANDETRSKLEEILENNQERYSNYDLDQGRENVITKGCTLAGYTTYDMYGEDTRAGVDLPKTLDCSSFVAWAFHKSGYTDVPYWSTTGTFVESSNFRYIGSSYESLLPGDIGLINMIASGGSNHVGIFVGYDDGGNPMWLHCTSHRCSGSSIEDGPRISYYPSFHLFYRYTGFRDEKV